MEGNICPASKYPEIVELEKCFSKEVNDQFGLNPHVFINAVAAYIFQRRVLISHMAKNQMLAGVHHPLVNTSTNYRGS